MPRSEKCNEIAFRSPARDPGIRIARRRAFGPGEQSVHDEESAIRAAAAHPDELDRLLQAHALTHSCAVVPVQVCPTMDLLLPLLGVATALVAALAPPSPSDELAIQLRIRVAEV